MATFYISLTSLFTRICPAWWLRLQNRIVSRFCFDMLRQRRLAMQRNLAPVLGLPPDHPRVRAAARSAFSNYGLYLMDYVRISRMTPDNFQDKIAEESGMRHIEEALAEGSGAILLSAHVGNWELGGLSFAARGCPIHVVSITDQAQEVQEYRVALRGTVGMRTLHNERDGHALVLRLVNLLRENKVLAMLGDRHENGRATEVTFFGRRVTFPSGVVALAQVSGAPIIPVFVVLRPDGRYRAWMEPPIRVVGRPGRNTEVLAEKTQELAAVFEKVIAAHPDQWFHFFDYWERYGCENPPR
jgi:KDO2-lipid IV(A) lauroyltransferase